MQGVVRDFLSVLRQLTLYPTASFITGLQSFKVVGVALATPIHELAAALRVPVVVKTGDPGPAGPYIWGQEAALRVVAYGESKRGQPHPRGGRVWFSQGVLSPLLQSRGASREGESANWGATAPPHGGWGAPAERGQRDSGCRAPQLPQREEAWTEAGVGVPAWGDTWQILNSIAQRGPRYEQRQKQQPKGTSRVHGVQVPAARKARSLQNAPAEGCAESSLKVTWPGCRWWVSAFCRASTLPTGPGRGVPVRSLAGRLIHARRL